MKKKMSVFHYRSKIIGIVGKDSKPIIALVLERSVGWVGTYMTRQETT